MSNPSSTESASSQLQASQRSTEFVAVQSSREQTSAEGLLLAAYIGMWVLVFGFLFRSYRGERRLEKRLAQLEGQLARLEAAEAPAETSAR